MARKIIHDENYLKAISYCMDNGIKIYAVPKNSKEYFVEVNDNGNIFRSPEAYNLKQWSDKIIELYEVRREKGEISREIAVERYDLKDWVYKHRSIFEGLLKSNLT